MTEQDRIDNPNTYGMWAEMYDMETGERKMIWFPYVNLVEYDKAWQFNWRENNYSCDCNRRELFRGVQDADYIECNGIEPNRYYVPFCYTADGRVIAIDEPREVMPQPGAAPQPADPAR